MNAWAAELPTLPERRRHLVHAAAGEAGAEGMAHVRRLRRDHRRDHGRAAADVGGRDRRRHRRRAAGRILNYEERQHRGDGSERWLRTSKIPLTDMDGNIVALLGLYEDITERKLMEHGGRSRYVVDGAA